MFIIFIESDSVGVALYTTLDLKGLIHRIQYSKGRGRDTKGSEMGKSMQKLQEVEDFGEEVQSLAERKR